MGVSVDPKQEDSTMSQVGQLNDPTASRPPTNNQDECWDGNCVKCGASQTPMWRSGPGGDKNMCNACGIRWKRNQEGLPLETEKTIRKRKKKKSELEILMCEDNDANDKRSRMKQHICDDLHNPSEVTPTSSLSVNIDQGELATSCPENSFMSQRTFNTRSTKIDAQSNELPSFSDSPFPFTGTVEQKHSTPSVQINSLRRSIGNTNPSESPFHPNFSSSVPVNVFPSTIPPTQVPSETTNEEGDRTANIDTALLRQILTRLENLRKEHRKTTEQVQIMVAELEANPELFSNANGTDTSPARSARNMSSSPFPMSSSVPFQR